MRKSFDSLTKIKIKLSPRTKYGIILLLIFGIAFSLRIFPPYDTVVTDNWVRFGGYDSWYHVRLVENLLHHFPLRISFDPYTFYPHGQDVFFAPLFDLLLGFGIWIVGLGSPTQRTIEMVSAYFPAVLGALVTIPTYFVGKELFNKYVGLLSAALVGIVPGGLLTRSLLGFTDHHVAEVLFSTTTLLFLILALKRAKEKETSFNHIRNKEWRKLKQPLIYVLLTGIALGMYLLSWAGATLLVFIIFTYMVLQYIIDHLRGKSTDYLCIIGAPIFLIALIMIAPFLSQLTFDIGKLSLLALTVSILTFPVLSGVSKLMESRNIKRAYYPLVLLALALVGLGCMYGITPSLLRSALGHFDIFTPDTGALTISEARPLLSAYGAVSLAPVWDRFTTGFIIAPIALILIAYAAVKRTSAEKTLFIVWTVVMLAATLSQVRFAYYFVVNVALLSGYFCWRIPGWISAFLGWLGFKEPPQDTEREKVEDRRKKKKDKSRKGEKLRSKERRSEERMRQPKTIITRYLRPKYVSGALAVIVVFFLAFYPNIGEAMSDARKPMGINDDWHSALLWMRDSTPDPFQDPDFYYELYTRPPDGEEYYYPPSAYGVMNWWDYGHWITAIAHRIPNANPHQKGAGSAAQFFTAQDEYSANQILDELRSKYVIIDFTMATSYTMAGDKITTGKFYNMAIWAGKSLSEFSEVYYRRVEGKLEPVIVYYPEYYQSMCSRLYNFGGKEVVPTDSSWVISYTERNGYTEITDSKLFSTYEAAKAYLDHEAPPNSRIVGNNPFISPVPLEKLEHYELVHHSDSEVARRGDEVIAYYVEIFEYAP